MPRRSHGARGGRAGQADRPAADPPAGNTRERLFGRLEGARVIIDSVARTEDAQRELDLMAFMEIMEGRTISRNDAQRALGTGPFRARPVGGRHL